MARLTQKDQIIKLNSEIDQLQQEITQLIAQNNDLTKKLYAMQENADQEFGNSPHKLQLENQLDFFRSYKELYESEKTKRSEERNINVKNQEKIHELINENRELKEAKYVYTHNERGAGRKNKLSADTKNDIIADRSNGMTMSSLAQKYCCSIGTIHKLINIK